MSANFQPEVCTYNETGSFRFWCQKVLPLVYDDSLSYYELLCKVVKYLNDVIENVDGLHDDVLSTNQAFYDLQNYVNNYFDNLDVQEEINAKLDAMALDGSLDTLLSPIVATQIGGVVGEQIGATVASQIDATVAGQIGDVVAEQIGTPAATATTAWLNEHVNPVGSAVIVDDSLSIEGAAADAKTTGDFVDDLKDALDEFLVGTRPVVVEDLFDASTVSDGKYVDYTDGSIHTNASYTVSDFIEIDPSTVYQIVGSNNTQMAMYNSSKEYVNGYLKNSQFNEASLAGTIPDTVQYIRTCFETRFMSNIKVNKMGTEHFYNDKILTLVSGKTVVTVGGANADYSDLKACFEDITPTEEVRVEVRLNAGTYDLRQLYNSSVLSDDTFYGLFIPDYVDLVGVGGAENTVITWDGSGDTASNRISTLNMRNNCTIKGITVSSNNIRYTIHDDYAVSGVKNVRYVKDCVFRGENLVFDDVYGSGEKGNACWTFENCQFLAPLGKVAFMQHNSTNETEASYLTFYNCRFVGTSNNCIVFSSMNTGTTALVHVTMSGNRLLNTSGTSASVKLNENNATLYGAGIKYKVSGFGNSLNQVTISNTDGVDYSSYIDLI